MVFINELFGLQNDETYLSCIDSMSINKLMAFRIKFLVQAIYSTYHINQSCCSCFVNHSHFKLNYKVLLAVVTLLRKQIFMNIEVNTD